MISGDLNDNSTVPGDKTNTGRTVAEKEEMEELEDGNKRFSFVDREVMIASVSVGFAGATIGGSYKKDDLGNRLKDNEIYNLGVKYQTGDVTIGGGIWVDVETAEKTSTEDGSKFEEDTTKTAYSVSVTYKLGPGIKVGGGLQFFETEYDDKEEKDTDAAGIVVGIGLTF